MYTTEAVDDNDDCVSVFQRRTRGSYGCARVAHPKYLFLHLHHVTS